MQKNISLLLAGLLALVSILHAADEDQPPPPAGSKTAPDNRQFICKEFPIEPLTRYRLTFNTAGDSHANARWELQVFNAEGLLPYEGVFREDWQAIVPDRTQYTHSFLTPRDGVLLKVIVNHPGDRPEVTDITLDKITNGNPVINGDFAAGLFNYSGWNDHHLAALETNEAGNIVLRCEPAGYALTDPIPVAPGATYRFTEGSTGGGRILVYDVDLLRVGWIDDYDERKNPFLKMPADAAFIRLSYCDGRENHVPVISNVGIERVEQGSGVKENASPPYPGEIILAVNSPLPEVRAAREIQHWVRKISGKEMRVLAAPSTKDNTKIYVGKKWAESLFPEDLKTLQGSDGFAVRQKGKAIYIFGSKPAGALFGAARFLEANSDLIWARPRREFGAVYSENPSLVFTNADFILRPAFVYRMTLEGNAARSDDSIWQGRLGLNSSASYYNRFERKEMGGAPSFCSNYMRTILQSPNYTFEICRDQYPGLFALIDGKRSPAPSSCICDTHPEAARAVAAGLCAIMKNARARGEELEFIGVRIKDGWDVCACEECLKPIPLPDGSLLKPKAETADKDPLFFSTRKAVLLNRVADEFAKTYPGIPLSVDAYIYLSEPPAVPYKPSLVPMFCAYDTCSLRFPILDEKNNNPLWARRFGEYLRRNQAAHGKLSMFTYYFPPGFSAVADSAAADWLAMVKSGGVQGIHQDGMTPDIENYNRREQYLHMWDYAAIERWVQARLLWDPSLDPQKLREDYIARAYREAAPDMLEFYNVIRKVWKDPEIKYSPNCHAGNAELFDTLIVKPGHEKTLRDLLVAAEKKAVHPNSKILVQRTLAAFDRFAEGLNRTYIPLVPESTAEWNVVNSTFWMQALKCDAFKQVDTWDDFKQAPAKHPTEVSVMRDGQNLYVRFQARSAGTNDRAELVLTACRGGDRYYFAMERRGKRYAMKNDSAWDDPAWKGEVKDDADHYIAMFKIPLAVIKDLETTADDMKLYAKFSRLVADGGDREESTLTGDSITLTHYMNYWTALSVQP